jgi:hypothetical protein
VLLCGIFITFGGAQTQICIARGWRSLVAAKGYPARSILHGCGIKSEWLALLEARFEPEKILVRRILFSQPNWGVLDELY